MDRVACSTLCAVSFQRSTSERTGSQYQQIKYTNSTAHAAQSPARNNPFNFSLQKKDFPTSSDAEEIDEGEGEGEGEGVEEGVEEDAKGEEEKEEGEGSRILESRSNMRKGHGD